MLSQINSLEMTKQSRFTLAWGNQDPPGKGLLRHAMAEVHLAVALW